MEHSAQWHFQTPTGEQVGPVDFQTLQQAAREGRFRAEDYVWREGDPDWTSADTVPGLFDTATPADRLAWFHGYAGFWRRAVAFLLDAILLGLVFAILIAPLLDLDFTSDQDMNSPRANLISALLGWLYYALMESSPMQATLGKHAIGIKVTDMVGQRISFLRATGRHFAKILSSLILLIGYIMAAFTPRKQALHDMLANCLVVKR